MQTAEAQLKAVRRTLATTVLRNIAELESAEVLFGQPVESRQASRRVFPNVTPYEGVTARHRGMVGHRHESLELGTVTAGRCQVMIEDMLYEARQGDWMLVRSHRFHAECPVPEDEAYSTFWFSPRLPPRHILTVDLLAFDGEAGYRHCRAESLRDMPSAERSSLGRLVYRPWDSLIKAQAELVQVIGWCLHNLVPWRSGRMRHRNPQVSRAQKLLGRLGRKPTVREVAEELGLTPKYLSHLFHRETGITIRAFVEKARMEEARRLLAVTSRTIKEVAANLGYSDTAHFSRAFRRAMGVTPSHYRRQCLEHQVE